ncbi:MAG: SRPBCC family protein [Thermomicrobiales bacterium]
MTKTASAFHLTHPPIAKAEMLIRKPVADVFEAFVDPAITAKFWFTKGSGKLEPGAHIQWDWEMYDASAQVDVKDVDQNTRILIEWSGYSGPETVEWRFTPLADDTTFVSIANAGFTGDGDALAKQAIDSTEAFTLVLAGLKAFLEHGVVLNLVADRFPAGLDAQHG